MTKYSTELYFKICLWLDGEKWESICLEGDKHSPCTSWSCRCRYNIFVGRWQDSWRLESLKKALHAGQWAGGICATLKGDPFQTSLFQLDQICPLEVFCLLFVFVSLVFCLCCGLVPHCLFFWVSRFGSKNIALVNAMWKTNLEIPCRGPVFGQQVPTRVQTQKNKIQTTFGFDFFGFWITM